MTALPISCAQPFTPLLLLGQDRGRSGFRGIWASGLTISASLSNEASWTQVLEVLECWPTPRNCPSW